MRERVVLTPATSAIVAARTLGQQIRIARHPCKSSPRVWSRGLSPGGASLRPAHACPVMHLARAYLLGLGTSDANRCSQDCQTFGFVFEAPLGNEANSHWEATKREYLGQALEGNCQAPNVLIENMIRESLTQPFDIQCSKSVNPPVSRSINPCSKKSASRNSGGLPLAQGRFTLR
jgi:hypothetical protein